MILLDTHVWVWWVHGSKQLAPKDIEKLDVLATDGVGVSIISCWEVAKLVEYGRLTLPGKIADWFAQALAYPGVKLLELTPQIIVDSTSLPDEFHRDPADQLLVANARTLDVELLTADEKILSYTHVKSQRIGR